MFSLTARTKNTQKREQIHQFLSDHPSTGVVTTEQEYSLLDPTTKLKMLIFLPPEFPQLPPSVRVLHDVTHPLLNARGEVVGDRGLQQWNAQSSLSQVITNILLQFKTTPPQKVRLRAPSTPVSNPNSNSNSPSPTNSSINSVSSPNQALNQLTTNPPTNQSVINQFEAQPHKVTATYERPKEFDELRLKSKEELESLATNEESFKDWFGGISEVQNKTQFLAEQMQRNAELASMTLSKEKEYTQLQSEVAELRKTYQEQKTLFDQMYAQQAQTANKLLNPQSLAQELQTAVNEAEKESEQIAEQLLDGKLTCSEFLKQFKEKRINFHVRTAKREMILAGKFQ
eukprot:c31061_g1_i1.p1 GENE.c31061_g1_i1~~c31061_g1_i1.p1  ORF type:complete len:343 (+),score=149.43 c31061_g1_i1:55-1083(+)